jgi:hypothetical protein
VPLLLIAIAVASAEEGAIGNGAAVHLVLEELGYGWVGGVAAGFAAALVVRVGVPRGLVSMRSGSNSFQSQGPRSRMAAPSLAGYVMGSALR